MKKCPFCAEEIQDEAIKCKHCGEWLKDETLKKKGTGKIETESEEEAEIIELEDEVHIDRKPCFDEGCIGTIDEKGICNECGRTKQDIENGIESKTKAPEKLTPQPKPGWGWGWLLIIFLYANAAKVINKGDYFHSFLLVDGIQIIGFIGTLILYFKLRRFFIDKYKFSSKIWLSSLKAGVGAYVFIMLIVGVSAFVGRFYENRALRNTVGKEIEAVFKGVSLDRLRTAVNELDQIEDIDTIPNIKKALNALEIANSELLKTERALRKFVSYVDVHRKELKRLNLDVALHIKDMHVRGGSFKHFEAVKDFFKAYKSLLVYSRDNIDKIINSSGPEWQKYEELYDVYTKALEKQNQMYIDKQKLVQQFCREHPEILEFFSERAKRELNL